MTKQYLLLTPINPREVKLNSHKTTDIMVQSGCTPVQALSFKGEVVFYATATTIEALGEFCEANNLMGIVVEYTGMYDQYVEIEENIL